MQVITIQRFYRDDANVACEIDLFGHSNPTDNKKHKKKVAAPSTLTFLLLERLVL